MDAAQHEEHKGRVEADLLKAREYLRRLEAEVKAVEEHIIKLTGVQEFLSKIEPKPDIAPKPEEPTKK